MNKCSLLLIAALGACTADTPRASTDSTTVSANTQAPPARPAPADTQLKSSPAPAPAPDAGVMAPLPHRWAVSPAGIGPVKAGMPVAVANAALGGILAIPAKLSECDYVRPKSAPEHLAFMVEKGEISRVEVQAGSDIATVEGAKIGDSESRIKALYPDAETRPSKYGSGHTLVVTPKNGGNNRIVFETDGKKVVSYRSGGMPAVEYVEGCG